MRILLAEDDHNIATIAQLSLEKIGGHKITLAENGELALKIALVEKFDLILLDEMMPKMNGLNVCKKYLEQASNPVPIIFLSAKSQESDIREFQKLSSGYIAKPFDPLTLNDQILKILKFKTLPFGKKK
ncbi:MAG: response regulator [Bdellovibrionales bacterium]|nr:response regulator [Bdellovibrionales bacterium]